MLTILVVVSALAPQMGAAGKRSFSEWTATRDGHDGSVRLEIAATGADEVQGIAMEIERQKAAGTPYRHQAVLARTHTILGRVADGLQAAGVPVLYLGNLFERPEVRDLLALVSLASEGVGTGLLRVAASVPARRR